MTKLEALKTLYAALGGTPADAAELETVVEVLNAIAELFEGETADTIADAVNNIAEIAGSISPTPTLITKNITENGTYTASTEDADGYSEVTVNVATPVPETFEVGFTINVPADGPMAVTSATKTYAELMVALNSGKNLVPTFDFTIAEGAVISSVTVGNGFINNSNDIYVACKITVEESGMTIGAYIIVSWFNPETHANEFGISFYNG